MFTPAQSAFLQAQRVARLATAAAAGQPHVIPVCYAQAGHSLYIALDAKPKRVAPTRLRRVRNIIENPLVSLVIDRYSDDWNTLAYLLIQGRAALIAPEEQEHQQAVLLLRERYHQYQRMPIHEQPLIAIRAEKVVAWGIEE